jgi:hypothetical protein
MNQKRVHRLCREEGLQRPTPGKQKRDRPGDVSVRRHQAEHPHQVWAITALDSLNWFLPIRLATIMRTEPRNLSLLLDDSRRASAFAGVPELQPGREQGWTMQEAGFSPAPHLAAEEGSRYG